MIWRYRYIQGSLYYAKGYKIYEVYKALASGKAVELHPEIEELHKLACENGNKFYLDPATSFRVMTSAAHRIRGTCCGSKCRHCPFDHVNVGTSIKNTVNVSNRSR